MSNRSFITFEQTATPTLTDGVEDGDLWLQPVTGVMSKYSGGAWVAYSFYVPPANPGRGVFGGGATDPGYSQNGMRYITISTPSNSTSFGSLNSISDVLSAISNGTNDRGVFGGYGYSAALEYITISNPGGSTTFGQLTVSRSRLAATSNGTANRGVWGGAMNTIDYITISTTGNAIAFGQLSQSRSYLASTSNATNDRGVFAGGRLSGGAVVNTIDYITISTPGNATTFGSLISATCYFAGTSNGTNNRGVFGGDDNSGYMGKIQYLTISTTGNATEFGALSVARGGLAAASNGTADRGVFAGGYDFGAARYNTIDYITVSSPGNATSFGSLSAKLYDIGGTSNA